MKLDTLAQRMRYIRKKRGLTQDELARAANTTQHVISKIEKGVSKRPRNLEDIAKVLDVSPAWLLFGLEDLDKLDKEGVEIALKLSEMTPEQRKVIIATIEALKNNP